MNIKKLYQKNIMLPMLIALCLSHPQQCSDAFWPDNNGNQNDNAPTLSEVSRQLINQSASFIQENPMTTAAVAAGAIAAGGYYAYQTYKNHQDISKDKANIMDPITQFNNHTANQTLTPEMVEKYATTRKTDQTTYQLKYEDGVTVNTKKTTYYDAKSKQIGLGQYNFKKKLLTFTIFYDEGIQEDFYYDHTSDDSKNRLLTMKRITDTDQSFTITIYKNNKIKRIESYNTQKKPIKIEDCNSDNSKEIIIYDETNQPLTYIYVNQHGIQKEFPYKLATAWHEAGHTFTFMHKPNLTRVNHATIKPSNTDETSGHVEMIDTYKTFHNEQELENFIMGYLSGLVGNQILIDQPMFNDQENFVDHFNDDQYKTDKKRAIHYSKELLKLQKRSPFDLNFKIKSFSTQHLTEPDKQINLEDIDKLLFTLYKKAYELLAKNKQDLKLIAQELFNKETISGSDAYNLILADMPLRWDEEGPLPESLMGDYKHRLLTTAMINSSEKMIEID